MLPVQFFLFGLFLAWFTGTGKLGKLLEALRSAPAPKSTSSEQQKVGPLPSIEIGGAQPTLDGRTNAITGALLDPSRPINPIGPLASSSWSFPVL